MKEEAITFYSGFKLNQDLSLLCGFTIPQNWLSAVISLSFRYAPLKWNYWSRLRLDTLPSRGHSAVPTFAGGTPPVPVARGQPPCLSPSAFTVLPVARRRYPDCSLWGLKLSFLLLRKRGDETSFIIERDLSLRTRKLVALSLKLYPYILICLFALLWIQTLSWHTSKILIYLYWEVNYGVSFNTNN